jgi:hypothetical protein
MIRISADDMNVCSGCPGSALATGREGWQLHAGCAVGIRAEEPVPQRADRRYAAADRPGLQQVSVLLNGGPET